MVMLGFARARSFLLILSGATAVCNFLLGSYMEEAQFAGKIVHQIVHFLKAKQTFPPVVHETIDDWGEPLPYQQVTEDKKVIWGYWKQGKDQLPGLCQLAVRSWKVHHPDWKIIILDDTNYQQYVSSEDVPSTFFHLKTQHRSDIVRLAVMRRYGGLYLDASYILFKNMDQLWDLAEQNGNFYITAPLSLPMNSRQAPMAFPNNAFLLTTQPQNPVLVAWHQKSLEFLETPVYTMDLIKQHPTMSRVSHLIGDPAFGPVAGLAPYVCNLWTMADTLYYEPSVRSYVAQHVFVLPTLMWTFDFVMVDLQSVPISQVPYKVYTSESWVAWLGRIPNALSFIFGDSQDVITKLEPVGNAMKASSDLSVWWNEPIEFILGLKSSMGRAYRYAVDIRRPNRPANLEGIYPVVPFGDDMGGTLQLQSQQQDGKTAQA